MVRISLGQKIAAAVAAVFVALLLVRMPSVPEPLYSASDEASDLAIVDGITKAEKTASSTETVRAVVVPHHLVASEAIALGIRALVSAKPKLVIIISPDHFGRCAKLVCTTGGSYDTFFGPVAISKQAEQVALSYGDVAASSELFTREHGVYAVVPFIKHFLPDAEIIPLAISQKGIGNEQSRREIAKLLHALLGSRGVIVISSDFSHYLPLTDAQTEDAKTEAAFCTGSETDLLALKNPAQSDCPLCLWLLHEAAIRGGFWHPALLWHSNSASLLRDESVRETTSHFVFALYADAAQHSCRKDLQTIPQKWQ